jgi:SAM-dependent methyltransferase
MAGELALIARCADLRIADLGCGRGHLGLAALALGARHVAFCDGSPRPLAWVAAVLAHNHLADRAACHQHRWGSPVPDGPYDLILGGDILYRGDAIPALVHSIADSLAPDGIALLGDPRSAPDPVLLEALASTGLTATHLRREAGYTLTRLNVPVGLDG